MCVVLDPDIIVASLAKSKVDFYIARSIVKADMQRPQRITITVDECQRAQVRCRTSGLGNVIADSSDLQFDAFLTRNSDVFKKISDRVYALIDEFLDAEEASQRLGHLISNSYPRFIRREFGFI